MSDVREPRTNAPRAWDTGPVATAQRRRAQLITAQHAADVDDLRMLLDVLGLLRS